VAALKCRQRKKQWLANLQAKVEIFSSENDALNTQVTQLREEIVNLKTLLLAHKDCPVAQAQGIGNMLISAMPPSDQYNPHANPYGMAMPNGQGVPPPAMQRRFVTHLLVGRHR
jgi:ATF/CREB family transcription factor